MDSGVCGFEPGSNRAALARRARCAARLAGERPERSEGKRLQARSQSLSPSHIKRPALCGFFNMDSGVCGFEPGSNRAALARRARCAARLAGERPERSEGKRLQARSQSLSPSHIKRPALCGFFNMDSGVCGFEPGSNRAALARRARCAARLAGERPERSEGKRLQARSQSLSPSSSLKSVYWHYLQERLWPRTSSHHIQRLAPQPWAGTLRYFPPWAKINDTVLRPLAYIVDESKQGTDSRIFYLQSEPRACR